jgi:UDP-glucose 4-epimerase
MIIGCTGFIGRNLGCRAALQAHDILGIARSNGGSVDWPFDYLQKDLSCSDFSAAIQDFAPDAVVHAAGPSSVSLSFEKPLSDLRAGVVTWANTLESVYRSKLRPLVIFPSSAAVYGNPKKQPIREDDAVAPISPYGFHKLACELLAREYSEFFGLNILICRLFSIVGPAQRRLLIWELYQQFRGSDSTVWIDGTGAESRDYLDIDDVIDAVFQIIEGEQAKRKSRQCPSRGPLIVNLASGDEIGVLQLAKQIGQLLASNKPIRCRGIKRRGETKNWRADASLQRSLIPNWRPKPCPLALSRCISEWQKDNISKAPVK